MESLFSLHGDVEPQVPASREKTERPARTKKPAKKR
jgi:hypothetical protein